MGGSARNLSSGGRRCLSSGVYPGAIVTPILAECALSTRGASRKTAPRRLVGLTLELAAWIANDHLWQSAKELNDAGRANLLALGRGFRRPKLCTVAAPNYDGEDLVRVSLAQLPVRASVSRSRLMQRCRRR